MQLQLLFHFKDETVASALVGARTTKQLLDSIIAYEKGCSTEQLKKLESLLKCINMTNIEFDAKKQDLIGPVFYVFFTFCLGTLFELLL